MESPNEGDRYFALLEEKLSPTYEYISPNPDVKHGFNNTVFNGGDGVDEITIPGKSSDYLITNSIDHTTVTKKSNGEIITLENVEKIHFQLGDETTVSVSSGNNSDTIIDNTFK